MQSGAVFGSWWVFCRCPKGSSQDLAIFFVVVFLFSSRLGKGCGVVHAYLQEGYFLYKCSQGLGIANSLGRPENVLIEFVKNRHVFSFSRSWRHLCTPPISKSSHSYVDPYKFNFVHFWCFKIKISHVL